MYNVQCTLLYMLLLLLLFRKRKLFSHRRQMTNNNKISHFTWLLCKHKWDNTKSEMKHSIQFKNQSTASANAKHQKSTSTFFSHVHFSRRNYFVIQLHWANFESDTFLALEMWHYLQQQFRSPLTHHSFILSIIHLSLKCIPTLNACIESITLKLCHCAYYVHYIENVHRTLLSLVLSLIK